MCASGRRETFIHVVGDQRLDPGLVREQRFEVLPLVLDDRPEIDEEDVVDLPRPSPPGAEGQLSETQRQIVELVVAGRRNREVAAELSLSPNTVAWNLSKIYRKLGVSSRTEPAARIGAITPE
jgi:DNA-binding NarL/FixJ family response regulator